VHARRRARYAQAGRILNHAWLIERRAPQEPTAYWGKSDRWFVRGPQTCGRGRVPEAALQFQDYDAALEIAEWLRLNQPLAYGEVIAVIPMPEVAEIPW
jgi:hypothetical protein